MPTAATDDDHDIVHDHYVDHDAAIDDDVVVNDHLVVLNHLVVHEHLVHDLDECSAVVDFVLEPADQRVTNPTSISRARGSDRVRPARRPR